MTPLDCVGVLSTPKLHSPLLFFAKVLAINKGLHWDISFGYNNIQVEFDSLLAVNAIMNREDWQEHNNALIKETWSLFQRHPNATLMHIFREANEGINWLVRTNMDFHVFHYFPNSFLNILYQDYIGYYSPAVSSMLLSNNIHYPSSSTEANLAGSSRMGATGRWVQLS